MSTHLHHYTGLKTQKAYDAKTALSLAVLCDVAYDDEPEIIQQMATLGFATCEFVSVRKAGDIDTQAFIASNDKEMVVSFRGSQDINDWFANFQAVKDPGPLTDTKAHEGFQDALFPAVIQITNSIDKQRDNNQRIWMTGHSLGGALCSLYAAMLFEAGYTVYGIYTFASPRPGDHPLAEELEKMMKHVGKGPHHRVMNDGDFVPHLPPEPFFSHSGTRMILKKDGEEKTKRQWQRLKVNMFKGLMGMTGNIRNIKNNHVLDGTNGYIARLVRQVNRGG